MEEQQIVLHSSAVPAEAGSQLVVRASGDDVGIPQAQRMEALRQDREAHRHKQIWIKDPHGGPYRKVSRVHVSVNECLQITLTKDQFYQYR